MFLTKLFIFVQLKVRKSLYVTCCSLLHGCFSYPFSFVWFHEARCRDGDKNYATPSARSRAPDSTDTDEEQRHIGGIQWLSEQKLFGFRWAILSTAYRIGTGLVWFGLRESGSTTLGKDCASSFARGRRTSNFVRRTDRVSRHWLGSSQENGSVCRYARQSFRLETAALLLLLFPPFCHSFPFFSSLVSHFSLSLSAFPTTLRPHATLRVMHFGTFLIPDLVHCSLEILLY